MKGSGLAEKTISREAKNGTHPKTANTRLQYNEPVESLPFRTRVSDSIPAKNKAA